MNNALFLRLRLAAKKCILVSGSTLIGTLLIFIICEFGILRGVRLILERSPKNSFSQKNPYSDSLSNPDKEYPGLFEEENAILRANKKYVPFLVWGYLPHSGKYVNIGLNGLRIVPNSINREVAIKKSSHTKRLFFFGGSTMLGQGSPDNKTIPALVCSHLNQETNTCSSECINFGIGGYVNSQELIELIGLLSRGDIPDSVIFYDGINEVIAAMQGTPGEHHNLKDIANIYETHQRLKPAGVLPNFMQYVWPKVKEYIYSQSNFGRVSKYVRERIFDHESRTRVSQGWITDTKLLESYLDKAAEVYSHNYLIACELAKAYGFRLTFIWQPSIFEKSQLSLYEKWQLSNGTIGGISNINYQAPWQYMKKRVLEKLSALNNRTSQCPCQILDYSDVFADFKGTIFYRDWQHANPSGNELISRRLFADIR